MASELGKRVLVAALGIPLALIVIYNGGWLLGGLLAVIAAAAARELYALAARHATGAFVMPGTIAAACYVLVATAARTAEAATPHFWTLTLVLILGLTALAIWQRGVNGRPLAAVAVTTFGAAFVGGSLSYGVFLRELPPAVAVPVLGAALVAFPVALTWLGDSAAYFAGRAWGRRKLIPSVSPGKTVEGALASLFVATIAGAAFAALVFRAWLGVPVTAVAGAAGGALVSVAAQVGDLAESLMKREAGVKDSGGVLPGHGGVLDRFDALFFTLPVAYAYLGVLIPLVTDVSW